MFYIEHNIYPFPNGMSSNSLMTCPVLPLSLLGRLHSTKHSHCHIKVYWDSFKVTIRILVWYQEWKVIWDGPKAILGCSWDVTVVGSIESIIQSIWVSCDGVGMFQWWGALSIPGYIALVFWLFQSASHSGIALSSSIESIVHIFLQESTPLKRPNII